MTREEGERNALGVEYIRHMKKVLGLGVPIVLASGNYGDQDKRDVIDTLPAVLEKDDFPIINVGAATLEGKAWAKTQGQGSQDGTQLTIYAVGEDVEVHNHVDGKETRDSGTSLAAPAVGGIIAVHMNYQPWDKSKTKIDRVKEIKRWIRTPESSWERIKNPNPDKPDMKVNMVSRVVHVRSGYNTDKASLHRFGLAQTKRHTGRSARPPQTSQRLHPRIRAGGNPSLHNLRSHGRKPAAHYNL